MRFAKRVEWMGSSMFAEMNDICNRRRADGLPVIDLSVGSPDLPPAPHITRAIESALAEPEAFMYALRDLPELKQAVVSYYAKRYGVSVAEGEIVALMGSQDGLAHIVYTLLDEGDIILVPNPGYPIYHASPRICGAKLYYVDMLQSDGWAMDLKGIPEDIRRRAKLIIASYPNNPTTAKAPAGFIEELVRFALEYDIAVVYDSAYSELNYTDDICPSFLSVPGALEAGVEFISLSKSHNMAGARVGFAVGNEALVSKLRQLKSQLDYGIFTPIQRGAIAALEGDQAYVRATMDEYRRRRDILCNGLTEIGWQTDVPEATMFVWAKLPNGRTNSLEFCNELARRSGVAALPGMAFGPGGEGYLRLALVKPAGQLEEAVRMIAKSGMI